MRKFVLKSILIIIILFVGVLIGMNKANQSMNNMRGYNESSFQTPVDIEAEEDGTLNAAVLGKEFTGFDLDEKKEKLEKTKSFNFFSELGKLLADIISNSFQAIVTFFASLF